LIELKDAVEKSSSAYIIGPVRERSQEPIMAVGSYSKNLADVESIPIGRRNGKTIKLNEVAQIHFDYDLVKSHVLYGKEMLPAVTVEYTKKKGTSDSVGTGTRRKRLTSLYSFDKNIKYEITRDYGFTAQEKSKIAEHLLIATSVMMIAIAMELSAMVVGILSRHMA
jgi:multidrug efflux pump subunit AcrB